MEIYHLVPSGTRCWQPSRTATDTVAGNAGDALMAGLFNRLFGRGGNAARPDTRLSEDEAMCIARQAAASSPLVAKLVLRGIWEREGRLAWHFWTPTRGSSLYVAVEDARGEAHVKERFGR